MAIERQAEFFMRPGSRDEKSVEIRRSEEAGHDDSNQAVVVVGLDEEFRAHGTA